MGKVLLLDYDWTLAPLNQSAGTKAVRDFLSADFGLKAEEVCEEFDQIYDVIDAIHHNRADYRSGELLRGINSYNIITAENLGNYDIDFIWSRELWLKYLSDKYDLELEGEMIMRIIDEYWDAMSSSSPLFPDASAYLSKLKDVDIFVITGSDRRLTLSSEIIRYEPAYSEKKKVSRIKSSGINKFANESHIITGDPFDKPCEQFWAKVSKNAAIAKDTKVVVVDDSLNVVKSAKRMGYEACLLDRRGLYGKDQVAADIDKYITEMDQLVVEQA